MIRRWSLTVLSTSNHRTQTSAWQCLSLRFSAPGCFGPTIITRTEDLSLRGWCWTLVRILPSCFVRNRLWAGLGCSRDFSWRKLKYRWSESLRLLQFADWLFQGDWASFWWLQESTDWTWEAPSSERAGLCWLRLLFTDDRTWLRGLSWICRKRLQRRVCLPKDKRNQSRLDTGSCSHRQWTDFHHHTTPRCRSKSHHHKLQSKKRYIDWRMVTKKRLPNRKCIVSSCRKDNHCRIEVYSLCRWLREKMKCLWKKRMLQSM